jgi:hypothetical protein
MPIPDHSAPVVQNPPKVATAITPSDSANLPVPSLYLYVGGTGDVKVDTLGGSVGIVFKAVPVGTILPIQVTKVYSTGTSATNLVGLS